MPTKQLDIAVLGTTIVTSDKQRTVLTLFNLDNANIIYFSDQPGKAITQMTPIFPETFISLPRKDGEEAQSAWYGRTAVQSRLAVLESYGAIKIEIDDEPDPIDDGIKDAPLMRRSPW